MVKQRIDLSPVTLEWTDWICWKDIEQGRKEPNRKSGVYEVRRMDQEKKLTIGKAKDLYKRVVKALVLGKLKHSTGRKIRAKENLSGIVVRRAETDRSAAVEEELHKEYVKMHGHLPAYENNIVRSKLDLPVGKDGSARATGRCEC